MWEHKVLANLCHRQALDLQIGHLATKADEPSPLWGIRIVMAYFRTTLRDGSQVSVNNQSAYFSVQCNDNLLKQTTIHIIYYCEKKLIQINMPQNLQFQISWHNCVGHDDDCHWIFLKSHWLASNCTSLNSYCFSNNTNVRLDAAYTISRIGGRLNASKPLDTFWQTPYH